MTEPIVPSGPPKLPPAPPRPEPACGHTGYLDFALVKAVEPAGDISGNTQAFLLRSLSGGDRELRFNFCNVCKRTGSYEYRTAGQSATTIGNDVQVVRAALTALLAQPDVDIFTLVTTDKDGHDTRPNSYVIPRHHLPIFRVQPPR